MYHSHWGGATKCWTMALLLPTPLAEREDGGDDPEHRGDEGAEIAPGVVTARQHRVLCVGQAVRLRLVGQQEEGVQSAVLLVAVQLRLRQPLSADLIETYGGDVPHRAEVAELDGLGRARLGAGGYEVGLQPVVAEGALAGQAAGLVEADDVVRAGRDAVAAAVAHLGLDVDRI